MPADAIGCVVTAACGRLRGRRRRPDDVGDTCVITWQWNSQLPARSGIHVIAIVAPGGMQLRHDARSLAGRERADRARRRRGCRRRSRSRAGASGAPACSRLTTRQLHAIADADTSAARCAATTRPLIRNEHVRLQLQKRRARIVVPRKARELLARQAGPLGDDEDAIAASDAATGGSTMNAPESCVSSAARNGSGMPVVVAQ